MEKTAKNYKGEPMVQFPEDARAYFYTFRSKPYYDESGEHFDVAYGMRVDVNGEAYFFSDDAKFFAKHQEAGIEIIDTPAIANPNAVVNAFWMEEYTPIATIYRKQQHYGGAEEGGWYYHTEEAVGTIPLEEAEQFNKEVEASNPKSYETHEFVSLGFFYGQYENLHRPIYC